MALKLLDRKIVAQNGICALCNEVFTEYSDIVPDHKNPRGMGGAGGTTTRTISRRPTGGAMEKRDRLGCDGLPLLSGQIPISMHSAAVLGLSGRLVRLVRRTYRLALGLLASFSAYVQNWPIDMLK